MDDRFNALVNKYDLNDDTLERLTGLDSRHWVNARSRGVSDNEYNLIVCLLWSVYNRALIEGDVDSPEQLGSFIDSMSFQPCPFII